MKTFRAIWIVGILAVISASQCSADFNGTDDFNDNSKDPAKWGADFKNGVGFLTETNQRLEFATSTTPASQVFAVRPWVPNFGSYTQSWEVQINLALPFNLSAGQEVSSGLLVYSGNAPLNNVPSNYLLIELTQDVATRRFKTSVVANGQKTDLGDLNTLATNPAVRIAFDSNTKSLSSFFDEDGANCGYSWTAHGATIVGTSWNLTITNLFSVAVYTHCALKPIASSDNMFFDNFCASSGAIPRLGITLGNGNVVISWPTNAPACHLESASTLTPPICWQVATNTPGIVSTNFTVTNAISSGNTFYRLSR